MVSGAVIIGQDLTLLSFRQIGEKVRFPLVTRKPVEVAYPRCLRNPEKWAYHEGILVYVYGAEDSETKFKRDIKSVLLKVGNDLEIAYCESVHKRTMSWDSKLHYSQIVWDREERKPFVEILRIFPEDNEQASQEYQRLASDLIRKTRNMRVKRYQALQDRIRDDAILSVSQDRPFA